MASLEERIVEWASTRPPWQRAIMQRIAVGRPLSESDYDEVANGLVRATGFNPPAHFSIRDLPTTTEADATVQLLSVAGLEHVNALTSDAPLTAEPIGLTVIFGNNGSGKSGYARLLKSIARARHQEEVLSDVFRDTSVAKPRALLNVAIGGRAVECSWPTQGPPELKQMRFYDDACGKAYIATESDFPFRPSALFVMDGLIAACAAIKERIDARLARNTASASALPVVDEDLRATGPGRFISQLSGTSQIETLDALLAQHPDIEVAIAQLQEAEGRLGVSDTTRERQRLTRVAEKLDTLRNHVKALAQVLGPDRLREITEQRTRARSLREAAADPANAIAWESLPGVGSQPWKEMWEAARRFSDTHAYPTAPFPAVEHDAKCVLCIQPLSPDAVLRLARFERFVKDDLQRSSREADALLSASLDGMRTLQVVPDGIGIVLKDIEGDSADLVGQVRSLLSTFEDVRVAAVNDTAVPVDLVIDPCVTELASRAASARTESDNLADPGKIKDRLTSLSLQRRELNLLASLRASRAAISSEISRRRERAILETSASDCATGPITRKVLELSEASITEVVRDTFTRETDRLRLERVTIAKTRADRGAVLHQPRLVGARQTVVLPRVFSEGEKTALGLAAFFTEAELDGSRSALILDDPVSSLDHVRRALVAARIAALAQSRQVIVFTHDVSFVSDLKREAAAADVPLAERSVTRQRGGERKPGNCVGSHPWKAKDAAQRLDELRSDLATIKRDQSSWADGAYDAAVADWAGKLSETWERIFSQEVVGQVLVEGGLEVRPRMVRVLARFTDTDDREFQASYAKISQWARRHDKNAVLNYVAPDIAAVEAELALVETWFKRVRRYKDS